MYSIEPRSHTTKIAHISFKKPSGRWSGGICFHKKWMDSRKARLSLLVFQIYLSCSDFLSAPQKKEHFQVFFFFVNYKLAERHELFCLNCFSFCILHCSNGIPWGSMFFCSVNILTSLVFCEVNLDTREICNSDIRVCVLFVLKKEHLGIGYKVIWDLLPGFLLPFDPGYIDQADLSQV